MKQRNNYRFFGFAAMMGANFLKSQIDQVEVNYYQSFTLRSNQIFKTSNNAAYKFNPINSEIILFKFSIHLALILQTYLPIQPI